MESRAKLLGHPLHQMLIVIPLGLLVTSIAFDGLYYFGGRNPRWADISYWMIVSGLIGGLVAAVSGWIGWFAIPGGDPSQGDRPLARARQRLRGPGDLRRQLVPPQGRAHGPAGPGPAAVG